jgi:hypothetical protein
VFYDLGFRDLVQILVGFVSVDDLSFDLIVSWIFSCFVCLLFFCLMIFQFCFLVLI